MVNIFKDAKDAYNEKRAALKAEYEAARDRHKNTQRTLQAGEETRSEASSRHSKSSRRSHRRRKDRDRERSSQHPLTEHNLSRIDEGSVISESRRSRKSASRHDDGKPKERGMEYRSPYMENAGPSQVSLVRRHTDFPTPLQFGPTETQLTRSTLPPSYHAYAPQRSNSVPDLYAKEEHVDMNLAYGPIPHHTSLADPNEVDREQVALTMSRIDQLLMEAHCVQHSASAIMANLQANPEAMAAVALTLAELSNLLTKVSPSIIASLRTGSPAIFALLASPQFLIAGGLALGITVVMFGGYKIIKRIQADAEAMRIPDRLEEPLVFGPRILGPQELDFNQDIELSSIDTWRRGIADAEAQSTGTSVDGEFITPAAAKQNEERNRDKTRDGRVTEKGSVVSGRSRRTVRNTGSESTIRPKHAPGPGSSVSKAPVSEAGTSKKSEKGKRKEISVIGSKEKMSKKSSSTNGLIVLFKKGKKGRDGKESVLSLRPKVIEI